MRPHPLKFPLIHAGRRVRAYVLPRWNTLRPVIRPASWLGLRAFGVLSLAFVIPALVYQFYSASWWENDVGFRQNIAALEMKHARVMEASNAR